YVPCSSRVVPHHALGGMPCCKPCVSLDYGCTNPGSAPESSPRGRPCRALCCAPRSRDLFAGGDGDLSLGASLRPRGYRVSSPATSSSRDGPQEGAPRGTPGLRPCVRAFV